MSELMNNECMIQCRNCGTAVTAKWHDGFLKKGWQLQDSKGTCPKCRLPIKIKNVKTIVCPHCHKLVEKTDNNICLSCHKHLSYEPSRARAECPECGVLQEIPEKHVGNYTCQVCGTVIPEHRFSQKAEPALEIEQYIKLPDVARMQEENWAVWKHPVSSFPFKSRMQVNEGTYGVFLQNGICKEPCLPGDYLLEDSDLEKTQKFDAAMQYDNIVFNTDVYCVLRDLPEISWGISTNAFLNAENTASYTSGGNGSITLQVCDAKAYMRYLGFKAILMTGLMRIDKEPGSSDGTLVQLTRNVLSDAVFACLTGKSAETLEKLVPNDIRSQVISELDRRMTEYGLCVKYLWISALVINKTSETQTTEQLRQAIQAESEWSVKGARLVVPGHKNQHADLDFEGKYRLNIASEELCFSVPEIRQFAGIERLDAAALRVFLSDKVNTLLRNDLKMAAQECLNSGVITDILDPNQYIPALRAMVQARVNEGLAQDGLTLSKLEMSLPNIINQSDALVVSMEMPARKRLMQKAAETVLSSSTEPIRVHAKDERALYVDIAFQCKLGMRIIDEESFYRLSEVRSLLEEDKSLIEKKAVDHYTRVITSMFQEVLGRVLQSVVDQTNADIRELHRFTSILKESVRSNMDDRLSRWGLMVESLDMAAPRYVERSANLNKLSEYEQIKSGTRLEQEILRLQSDHLVFKVQTDTRNRSAALESDDQLSEKEQQLKERQQERAHVSKMAELRRGNDLDRLADEISQAKHEREAQAIMEDYRHKFKLREEQIEAENRASRMQLDAAIDLSMRKRQAEYEQKLNDAENQRALNDLMREINDSDLTWQQKLDEYDRLRRLTIAESQSAIKKIESETDIRIERDQSDLYYQTSNMRIRLNAEQAKLVEEIKRFDEERQERMAAASAAREERRAVMDFEHRLQDRREQIAQQMEHLNAQYDHELAMREKEFDLQKLIKQLDAVTAQSGIQSETEKTAARAEAASKIAQAQAEAKRLEEHLAREEGIAEKAQELQKSILETQSALELVRLSGEKNRDDKLADVAIAANQAQKRRADREVSERLDHLKKKMDRISSSYRELAQQVQDIKSRYPYGWGSPGHPPVYPGRPAYPAAPVQGAQPQPGILPTMPCPLCRQEIPSNARVCPYCSTPIL